MFFLGPAASVFDVVVGCTAACAVAVGIEVGTAVCIDKLRNEPIEYVAVTEPKVKNKTGDENKKNEKKKQRNTKVDDLCPICINKLTEDDFQKLDCGHAIHADCYVARHRYSYHEECVYCGCDIFKGDSKKQK